MGLGPFFFGESKMLNRRADKLELLRIAEAVALEKSIDKELIISSLSIDFSRATDSAILNNSSLSDLLFNIFVISKKKWAEAHFEISTMYCEYRYFFYIFNFNYLLKTFALSVFSHENAPFDSGSLPK